MEDQKANAGTKMDVQVNISKTRSRVLLIDNTIDPPKEPSRALGADFRRYLDCAVEVRRGPDRDLPLELSPFTHIILSGSKTSILESGDWIRELSELIQKAVDLRIPILGICYGHQLISRTLGGSQCVRRTPTPEIGWREVTIVRSLPIFEGLSKKIPVFQAHFDEVTKVPQGAVVAAENDRCEVQAFGFLEKPIFGVQFHPERNFVEGEESIRGHERRGVKKNLIFKCRSGNQAKLQDSIEQVAKKIFSNFLKISKE